MRNVLIENHLIEVQLIEIRDSLQRKLTAQSSGVLDALFHRQQPQPGGEPCPQPRGRHRLTQQGVGGFGLAEGDGHVNRTELYAKDINLRVAAAHDSPLTGQHQHRCTR